MHSLASHIYEKGPQTLADAIVEVKKLQGAQQLTATLIPSSTANVMLQEEDYGFQFQESGHIACHCPNVQYIDCNEYGHILVDCPHSIPPSGTPAHHHRLKSWHRHHNRSTSHHYHNTDTVGLGHNPILTDTAATATMIPTEGTPGHIVGTAENIIEVLHDAQMLISTILTLPLYIEDHLLTEAYWLTHEIT